MSSLTGNKLVDLILVIAVVIFAAIVLIYLGDGIRGFVNNIFTGTKAP